MAIHLRVLEFLFPGRCVLCDEPVDKAGEKLCRQCRGKIVYIRVPFCMKCGKQLLKEEREYCEDCEKNEHLFLQGTALYDYGSMSDSIFRFKYGQRMEYAAFYGRDLYEKKRDWLKMLHPDALVPVPVHPSKKRSRGYNQSELIARELSKCSGIPLNTGLIRRVKATKPLKNLTPAERQNNLKRAFKIKENDVKLSTIIIVDDIYTTGSTIDAMAEVLKEAGIARIYFMALTIGRGI